MSKSQIAAPETAAVAGLGPRAGALALAALGAAALYFPFRAHALNPAAPLLSAVVFAAELIGLAALCLWLIVLSRSARRTPRPYPDAASVDVLVIAGQEPAEAVRRSLVAGRAVRGAGGLALVDRAGRDDLAALAEAYGVAYFAPAADKDALNAALAVSKADFLALVSARHALAAGFAERTLGYLRDPHAAFVQADLSFDAAPRSPWSELLLGAPAPMSAPAQRARDGAGAALLGQSCALLRRSALARVGGFAAGAGWALATALRLHQAGYVSAFQDEALARRVTEQGAPRPADFRAEALAAWRAEGVLLAPRLTLKQRASYLAAFLGLFDAPRALLFLMLPALALCVGVLPASPSPALALHILPWLAVSLALTAVLRREPDFTARLFKLFRRTPRPARPRALGIVEHARDLIPERPCGKAVHTLGLWAAVGFAAFALAAGAARFAISQHVSIAVFAVSALWLLGAFALSAAELGAARRKRAELRADLRLPADCVVSLHLPSGGWREARMLDATADGVRLAAPLGLDIAAGQKVEAVIAVGVARLPVVLRVRWRRAAWADETSQQLELGCAVTWTTQADQDVHALALYTGAAPELANENEPEVLDEQAAA